MTPDSTTRAVPITCLRKRYDRLGQTGVSTRERHNECTQLAREVTPLLDEFLDAVHDLESYDNRCEGFYPEEGRLDPKARKPDGGTGVVTDRLAAHHPVAVSKLVLYEFEYMHREVNPLRTTRGKFVDGTPATPTGKGGIDYVALLDGRSPTPILGEIKVGSDKDAYYAFVQLLTYLSELSSKAQITRANKFLFNSRLVDPVRFDLHIMLWNYNDRGQKGPIIDATCRLAATFKARLAAAVGASSTLGQVLCLRDPPGTFAGALDLVWSA